MLPTQYLSASTQVDVLYSSDADIAGFQFNVENAELISASGGDAEANGFMVSAGNNTVLGFSLTGSVIPAGSGILTILEVDSDGACISNLILAGQDGGNLGGEIVDCLNINYTAPIPGCTDETACNYDENAEVDDGTCEFPEENYDCDGNCLFFDCLGNCGGTTVIDECNICDGPGIPEGDCDCNGNTNDCSGVCGGDATEDECGVCNGDGFSCAIYNVDVLFNSDTDIAGFQFHVDNVVLIGASGGEAEANDFMVSSGNNTVLGFSLTGSVIPAGSGVLTTLEVQGQGACISELILAGQDGGNLDADVDCLSISYTAPIPGCTNANACNYDENAGVDDGSCEYPEEYYDCDGNCIAEIDCTGECGGSAEVGECGVCGGSGIPTGECDCNGNVDDCAGACGGDAVEDDCGVCNGDGTSCLFVTLSMGAVTESSVEIWLDNPLEVAGFQFNVSGINITGASGGSAEENAFMVSTSSNTVLGFSLTGAVIPIGNAVLTNLSFDSVSGADICLSNAVISSTTGSGLNYELSACLNPSDYFNGGCSDAEACNYESDLDFDDGSCTYPEENFDCDGNCILEYDCANVCGGSSEFDECGDCGGSGPAENFDCDGNCVAEIDCAGECGGNLVLDECGFCGGDGSLCDNPQATLSFGDLGGDVLLQVSYIDPVSEICIANPVLSDPDGSAVQVLLGACTTLNESPGVLEVYLNSAVDIAGFQFNITGMTITGGSGGMAESSGMMISTSSNTVLGFSFSGDTMGANGSVGCMDESACNYDADATIPGGCQYEVDCAGTCGGLAVEDECGICNGPGAEIECWDGEMVCDAETCSEEPVFTDVDYLTDIQPIFNANCTAYCHSGGGGYTGGLDLTSYENLMAGDSDNGPVVIPGDSENSILIQKLSDNPPFGNQMPDGYPPYLDPSTIALIAAWIDEGALPSEEEEYIPPLNTLGVIVGDGIIEVYYNSLEAIAGFQFSVMGAELTGASGGAAEENGFTVSFNAINVLGFSLTESTIPAGSGVLTVLSANITSTVSLNGIVVAGPGSVDLGFGFDDGTPYIIYGCTDPIADNFDPFATDDDGSCTYPPLGELTFGAIDFSAGTLEINLDCEYAVSNFTFDLSGLNITGAYGGSSETAGIEIGIDGTTISGNSTSENVPAHSGLLMVVTFDGFTEEDICFSNSSITTYTGIEYEAILDDCLPAINCDVEGVACGCTIEAADNYDPFAILPCNEDNSCCVFSGPCSPTDSESWCYDPDATTDDGSGIFMFECRDGMFIFSSAACNGVADCLDGSDETVCWGDWNDFGDEGCGVLGLESDCDGLCFPSDNLNWLGDGLCDDGSWQLNFNCEAYDYDGGDCITTIDLSIPLISGWNWISFNLNPEDASLGSILEYVGESATFISSQSFGTAQNYGDYGWYGGLTELDPTQMYKLQMTAAADLVITGMPVDVTSTSISLIAGWNWIGYLPQNAGDLGEALASVGELATFISSQSSGTAQNYGDYGWYGGLATLEPGNGYLLDMSAPGELIYPDFNSLARLDANKQEVILADKISHWDFNYADYQYIGTITASIDSRVDFDGDVVGVFVDDECRGLAERMYFPFDDRYMYIIQAYSNLSEGEKMTFKYYDSARDEVIEYRESISFNSNMVVGDGFNTFSLKSEVDDQLQPLAYGISEAYPNPFNPVTSFSYIIPEDGMVQVAVYDVSGRMVADLINGWHSAGNYPVVWDANELSSGVYLLKMVAGEYTNRQKVMLIK
ncbi:MAG: T9SS type A sorting domain-containing protein [Candidatus Marinimicrobia bacterium]|nr:T9SS type A sorting domain-containing protein [Candidatus Neomarinimicrobiota bacterium]